MGYDCYIMASPYPKKSLLIMVSNIAGQAVAMGDETKGMSLPVVTGFNSECFTRMKQAQRVFQKAIYI